MSNQRRWAKVSGGQRKTVGPAPDQPTSAGDHRRQPVLQVINGRLRNSYMQLQGTDLGTDGPEHMQEAC